MPELGNFIKDHEATVEVINQYLENENQAFLERLERAQKEIIEGKNTTGSQLLDGLVAVYGGYLNADRNLVSKYELISNDLVGKKDQPFLVINRQPRIINCVGFGAEAEYNLDIGLSAGVLSDEKLVFNYEEGGIYLPTERFFNKYYKGKQVEEFSENYPLKSNDYKLNFGHDVGAYLDLRIQTDGRRLHFYAYSQDEDLKFVTMLLGNKEIETYFSKYRPQELKDTNELFKALGLNEIVFKRLEEVI